VNGKRQAEQLRVIGPNEPSGDAPSVRKQIVVINPIERYEHEADQINRERGQSLKSAAGSGVSGAFSSSTMMVMMTAMTPSEKASSSSSRSAARLPALSAPQIGRKEKGAPHHMGATSIVAH
jgi:hypothetical protein